MNNESKIDQSNKIFRKYKVQNLNLIKNYEQK